MTDIDSNKCTCEEGHCDVCIQEAADDWAANGFDDGEDDGIPNESCLFCPDCDCNE